MTVNPDVRFPLEGVTINGKYRLTRAIGVGGMGAVYHAEQLVLNRTVAVKVLNVDKRLMKSDPNFERRFFLEASLSAKIQHPNVVTVFDYGEIEGPDGGYFIAMEYLAGGTLQARLHEGPMSVSAALILASGIARGLREAHKQNVVHRDLKPSNVILVEDEDGGERPKIVDFGLVKSLDDDLSEDLTQQGTFLGSPKYMSPEQMKNIPLDGRTDLYSLGVILYQCLCGSVPFDGTSSMQILVGHATDLPPWFRDRAPHLDIPEPVELLVRKLLEKDRENRPESADAFLRELRSINASTGGLLMPTGYLSAQTGTYPAMNSVGTTSGPSGPVPIGTSDRSQVTPIPIASQPLSVRPSIEPSLSVIAQEARRPAAPPRWALTLAASIMLFGSGALYVVLTKSRVTPSLPTVSEQPSSQTTPTARQVATPSVGAATPTSVGSAVEQTPTVNGTVVRVDPTPSTTVIAQPVEASGSTGGSRRIRANNHANRGTPTPTTPTTTVTPTATATIAPNTVAAQAFGFLTFDTTPWSTVSVDGRSIGTTPLLRVRLPAGPHTLVLRNPEQNISTTYSVTVRADETITRRIGIE